MCVYACACVCGVCVCKRERERERKEEKEREARERGHRKEENMGWGEGGRQGKLGDRAVPYPLSHFFNLLPTLDHSFVQLPTILIFAQVTFLPIRYCHSIKIRRKMRVWHTS